MESKKRHPLDSLSRRDMLRLGAAGVVASSGMESIARAVGQCAQSPAQTAGPYWVDEMLNRCDIRTDPTSRLAQPGLPLRLALNISEFDGSNCTPMSDAVVDIWHANAYGVYSDVSDQGTVGERWLRGYQLTDDHGNVKFLTNYPGWYQGRTIHVHFRVRRFSGKTTTLNFVSQLYFDDAMTADVFDNEAPYNKRMKPITVNANDGIFTTQLQVSGNYDGQEAVATFNAVVNTSTAALSDATPEDPDGDHYQDFGGGTPQLEAH